MLHGTQMTITSDNKLEAMSLSIAENIPGAIAELGVYQGGSARFLARAFPKRRCILFDTFSGIPFKGDGDKHNTGDFGDTSLEAVKRVLSDCANVEFAPGIFPATALPFKDETFALVYLDADQYQSTLDGLNFFWPRLSPGGVIALDDYGWPNCPGVKRALEEFGEKVHTLPSIGYFAYLRK